MTITREMYEAQVEAELAEIGGREEFGEMKMIPTQRPKHWNHPKRPARKPWMVWHPTAQGGGRLFFAEHKEGLEWIRKFGGTLVRNQIGGAR